MKGILKKHFIDFIYLEVVTYSETLKNCSFWFLFEDVHAIMVIASFYFIDYTG